VFLEPIALYNTRDLYAGGDGLWQSTYDPNGELVPLGSARAYGDDDAELLLVSFANGVPMSLRVARKLAADHGTRCRVLDLRWLAPLPVADLLREARAAGRVLVVDETRRTGGVSEGILTALIDAGYEGRMARVTSHDSFIPLGDAANLVLLSEADIEQAALRLLGAK
jgi:2-oxoisovalerate dehydrogenase E1 component